MRIALSISICLFAACKRQAAPAPQPAAPAAATTPGFAADTQGVPGTKDLEPLSRLQPVMADEAAHRPGVKVPVEKLFDALAAQGIALANRHQVLARTADAAYCMLGVTKDTIAIAACEYPSHEAAVAGEQLLDARYKKLVPDAVREINGQTLITVANAEHHADERDRVVATFRAL